MQILFKVFAIFFQEILKLLVLFSTFASSTYILNDMRIKEVIKNHGLSVKSVAGKMGISAVGLSQHINGNPSVEVLQRIAEATGCSVGEFFNAGAITCPNCGAEIRLTAEKI